MVFKQYNSECKKGTATVVAMPGSFELRPYRRVISDCTIHLVAENEAAFIVSVYPEPGSIGGDVQYSTRNCSLPKAAVAQDDIPAPCRYVDVTPFCATSLRTEVNPFEYKDFGRISPFCDFFHKLPYELHDHVRPPFLTVSNCSI